MASDDSSSSSSMSSNDSSSDDTFSTFASSGSDVSFAEDLCKNLFHVKYRMSLDSFNKLLDLLTPALRLKEQFAIVSGFEPICCELMLHCAIR